jgi:hypothetical protein
VLGIFYRVVSILRYIVCVSGTYHDNMLNLFSGITSIPISVYIPVIILPITIILLVLLIIYRNSTVWRIIIITLAAALILITKVFSNQYITIIASRTQHGKAAYSTLCDLHYHTQPLSCILIGRLCHRNYTNFGSILCFRYTIRNRYFSK